MKVEISDRPTGKGYAPGTPVRVILATRLKLTVFPTSQPSVAGALAVAAPALASAAAVR